MVIGVTGSIATGKTFVSDYLKKLGYNVIDADEVSRKATNIDNICYQKIVNAFSNEILLDDKNINRQKLAKIIYSNPNKKKILEEIIHPYVFLEIEKKIKKNEINFVVVPLLFETHYNEKIDKTIYVFSREEIQIQRLMNRDNIDEDYAMLKIKNQLPQSEKMKLSDYIIDNSNTKEDTMKNIEEVLRRIKNGI